jgi:hypothetical protein
MSASTPPAGWTAILAVAVAHDVNNLAQGLAAAGASAVEDSLLQLRKLGLQLRVLATAGEVGASARVDEACADALVEIDPGGGQVRLAAPIAADLRVGGTPAAVRTAITSLLEHALAASPTGAPIELNVRNTADGSIILEIAARAASEFGAIAEARLDLLLATTWRDLRGDLSLVLAGAIAEALGGAVFAASDPDSGLRFALHLRSGQSG